MQVTVANSDPVLEEALNLLSIAVFVIDSGHRVVWMNRHGRALVESKNGLALINGKLRGDTTTQTREIDEILDLAVSRQTQPQTQPQPQPQTQTEPGRTVLAHAIARRSSPRPLRLIAAAVGGGGGSKGAGGPLSIVYVGDDDSNPAMHPELLGTLFGLTRTEARVAARVADGLSPTQVAGELKLGTGTVRWHVKRIMARVDVGRQAELVRLVMSSPLGYLAI
jgi:DNA-binding CsgD family transcriptional regulator